MLQLAREADWEAVKRLSVQVHELHVAWRPDIFRSVEEPYPKEKFLEDIRKRLVYVAKFGETIVGYTMLSLGQADKPGQVPQKVMILESVCVEKSFRGHGIGKAMMTDVRALAKAFGCRLIRLGVYPQNDEAVGFYQKCGFLIRSIQMDTTV